MRTDIPVLLYCNLAVPCTACYPPRAEWVRSYSSAEYLRLPSKAEAVLDETSDSEPYGERCSWERGC